MFLLLFQKLWDLSFALGRKGVDIMTSVDENDEGNRSVDTDSEPDVEYFPTEILKSKIHTCI